MFLKRVISDCVGRARSALTTKFTWWRRCISGALLVGDSFAHSRIHDIDIVDRVGSGDAFAAGAILAILEGMSTADGAEFATAASVLAHSIEGDVNISSRAEIEKLARGGDSRIVR